MPNQFVANMKHIRVHRKAITEISNENTDLILIEDFIGIKHDLTSFFLSLTIFEKGV